MPNRDPKDTVENPSENIANIPNTTRSTRAIRHKAEHLLRRQIESRYLSRQKMSPKSTQELLTATDGSRRKSSRVKPSSKEKKNIAQRQEGIIDLEDGMMDAMDMSEDAASQDVPQWFKKFLETQASDQRQRRQENEELKQQIAVIIQQNNEMQKRLAQAQQRAEELEIQLHYIQEQNATTAIAQPIVSPQGHRSYAEAALRGAANTRLATAPFTAPRAEEFFCTIDFSRVEEGEKAVDAVAVREKIEKEVQKGENKEFRCRAVTKDARTKQRIRILCRSEAELDIVKQAATATAVEGARILRDQLYPVKVNNVRTDAILRPNGEVKEEAMAALNDSNNTKVAKLSWLSSRQFRKAYGSMVLFFTKRLEAERFLRDGFFTVGGESAYVRVFEPSVGPPRCYNCQGIGHKAYSCKEVQRCGKCAQVGHSWTTC